MSEWRRRARVRKSATNYSFCSTDQSQRLISQSDSWLAISYDMDGIENMFECISDSIGFEDRRNFDRLGYSKDKLTVRTRAREREREREKNRFSGKTDWRRRKNERMCGKRLFFLLLFSPLISVSFYIPSISTNRLFVIDSSLFCFC